MSKHETIYRFSIVIPCYNEEDYIADTLRSLSKQVTSVKYEVIVVDNNCKDKTAEIARSFGAKVIFEKNPGVCSARQAGTKAAYGEIIISTDADTIFSQDWLETIDKTFKKNERIVAVGGPCRYFDGPWWGRAYTHFLFRANYIYSHLTGHPFYLTATNIAFKKAAWTGYDLNIMQGGDELDLLDKLRRKGKVKFNNSNPTFTSGRRLTRGLAYNFFVTFLYYYVIAYNLDKILNRSVIGTAPAFRETNRVRPSVRSIIGYLFIAISLAIAISLMSSVRGFVADNIKDSASIVINTIKSIS